MQKPRLFSLIFHYDLWSQGWGKCEKEKVLLRGFEAFYLFQFGQSQRVVVFDFELHKAHVGRVGELCYDTKSWEQSVRKKKRETERENWLKKLLCECEIAEQVWAKQTWKGSGHWRWSLRQPCSPPLQSWSSPCQPPPWCRRKSLHIAANCPDCEKKERACDKEE